MFDDELLQELTIDDLSGGIREIAEIIGIDNVVELIKYAGGDDYYIPSIASYKTMLLERYLRNNRKQLNSYSKLELIRKFKVSGKTISKIRKQIAKENRERLQMRINI